MTYEWGTWIPAEAGMAFCGPFDRLRANGLLPSLLSLPQGARRLLRRPPEADSSQ